MKLRKLLSVVLALCLVLSFVPMTAVAAEAPELEAKDWPASNTIVTSGIYTVPANLSGTVTVNGNVTVKLIGNAAHTTDNPYSGLNVACKYGNTHLIIENLNVNSTGGAVLEFARIGNTLTLEGENTFNGVLYGNTALVQVDGAHYTNQDQAAELTITGTGTLNATQPSDTFGAAIGGQAGAPCGNLIITGGIINAVTQGSGAAIGAGSGGNATSITITGGTVYAESRHAALTYGGYNQNSTGAAIGGGYGTMGGEHNITITGGTVTAVTSTNSAAIGSGLYLNGSQGSDTANITITGGKVMAYTESNSDVATTGGAAIGSAYCGGAANISIEGGEVIAVTRTAAAAIGSGAGGSYYPSLAATVTVNGGTVTALANSLYDSPSYKGPAIGRGCYGTMGKVYINAGAVLGVGNADVNINGTISNSFGEALNEVVLDIPDIQSLTIDGIDWNVSDNHADLTLEGGYDYTGEVHIWLPAYDGALDLVAVTGDATKHYDLWANGTHNEYHTVAYVLSEGLKADGADKVYDPITAPGWNEDLEGTLLVDGTAGCSKLPEYITVTVGGEEVDCTYDPRTGEFLVDGGLLTGDVVITAEGTAGHSWSEADCDTPKTCANCGATEGEALGHDYQGGICSRCGNSETGDSPVTRLSGKGRCETAILIAEELKAALEVEKFNTIIIANGNNFADALAGSYLAAVKDAPILLSWGSNDKHAANIQYIQNNLVSGGTVYILGGTAAVPGLYEEGLADIHVERLSGKSRFDTNIEILKAAGIDANSEILVSTGWNYADSLSASATGKPILLLDTNKGELSESQTAFLSELEEKNCTFTIIGGTGAVSFRMERILRDYGITVRISGKTRYETSVELAKAYFGSDAQKAVLAYGENFPDGLCGSSLAYAMKAPLILTMTGREAAAAEYMAAAGIESGVVLGGEIWISDEAVRTIFAMEAADQITVK